MAESPTKLPSPRSPGSASLRRSLDRLGTALHIHRHGSSNGHHAPHGGQLPAACHSEEEAACLAHLRSELQRRGVSVPADMVYGQVDVDATLMRFARARKLDVGRALHMLEATIKWRRDNRIDQVLLQPLELDKLRAVRKCKVASYIGFDQQGKPVYVDRIGKLDVKGAEALGLKEEDILRYHIQEMEFMGRILLHDTSQHVGRTVDTCAMILDAEGLALSSFTATVKSLLKKMLTIDSDHYPETNGGTWIVNAPLVFSTIWAFVKPFIDPHTRSKITVCPSNKAKAQAMLVQHFGRELLPTFLGGDVDFEAARGEWAAKMDACLEQCQLQYKETGCLDTSTVRLS